jgi:hypothetical protein
MSAPAVWLRGNCDGTAQAEIGIESGTVVRLKRGDREIERLRVQPLHRDVQVALERTLHRIVERQLHDGSGRWRGGTRTRLVGPDCGAGPIELPCGLAGDRVDAGLIRGVLCQSGAFGSAAMNSMTKSKAGFFIVVRELECELLALLGGLLPLALISGFQGAELGPSARP